MLQKYQRKTFRQTRYQSQIDFYGITKGLELETDDSRFKNL